MMGVVVEAARRSAVAEDAAESLAASQYEPRS